jgi:predicted phage baseplate assembly protein
LDATDGRVRFGDGRQGFVPDAGATIVASYRTTVAGSGNVTPGAIQSLSATPHNDVLLAGAGGSVRPINPVPATGGAPAESLEHAEGRALAAATQTTRAVTLADYEALALGTPGVRLARVVARANAHPGFPCVNAVGVVSVMILPFLPTDRPVPSAATCRAVAAHLKPLRLIGTRIEVTGPTYMEVSVRASVRFQRTAVAADIRQRVSEALDSFLHPLRGGPAGSGWPLGRDIVRSEVLQVIDEVPGVDHVVGLELVGPRGGSCGDLCLGPLDLVVSRAHAIEVVQR